MTMHRTLLGKLAFSTFLATISLNAAFAQETTAVADRLKTALGAQGIELGWSNITGDAASMTIEGATIKPAGEKEGLPIGNVTLADIAEEDGGYVIGTLTTQPFNKTQDGITLDMSSFVVKGMHVPAEGSTDPLKSVMMYDSAELATVAVKMGDRTAFSMNGLTMEITPPEDSSPMEFTGAVEKFTGDLSLVQDPQSKAVIDALGYQQISGFIEAAGTWQPSDGQLALSQYDISVEDAGTFGMTFDFGGYTLDFVKSMQDLSKKMSEQPAGGDNSAQGMAMLGLMQQLTLNGASVRFDDDSLTGKILDYVAKQQNQSAKDIANQAKAIVPFLVGQLNNPDLGSQITAAVNAYMDDPQNIEIAAAPPAPVPFAQIMGGAMSNPMDLTRTLGVKVTANQQ